MTISPATTPTPSTPAKDPITGLAMQSKAGKQMLGADDFMKLLNEVAKGKTKLDDLLTYTCGKSNITVTVNNAEKITLNELFNKLKEEKKLYIKKSRNRTNANNCILDLEVETKKKLM
jgi:hypothetical protein